VEIIAILSSFWIPIRKSALETALALEINSSVEVFPKRHFLLLQSIWYGGIFSQSKFSLRMSS
jgi:hypothetical protein